MFDILDDNKNFSNLSTFPNRSASMKKVPKKENMPVQQRHNNNLSSFDQLINGFLDKSSKKPLQNSENLSRSTSKKDNLDIFDIDLPNHTSPKVSIPLNTSSPSSTNRFSEQQQKLNNHFGNTQKTIVNPSKLQQSFVSSRNMKPPIKKRQNYSYMTNNIFNSQIGAIIPQQDPNLTNSSNKMDEEYPRLKNRRSSIDARSQINIDQSFVSKHELYTSSQDKVKEEPLEKLVNTESHIIDWKHNDKPIKNQNKTKNNQFNPASTAQQKQSTIAPQITDQQISQRIQKSNKLIIEDYQRQINLIKQSHQRQASFMQQQLNKQILVNKQMRQTFMKQTSKIIDEQRERSKNIHQQQINRLKDMFQWEKKKITDTFKCQIDSLKNIANYQQKNESKPLHIDPYQLNNTQAKLKLWQSSLRQKQNSLDRRQIQLSEKITQINIQKRHDDQRVRSQQKRLIEMQMSVKKQIMMEKQSISQERQKMSAQIGQLELQILKERQRNHISTKENQIERQSIQRQKAQLRRISNQVMHSHKINLEQIQQEKQRLSQLELQLIKKIRTVQMKAKELSINRNNKQQHYCVTHQQPNYIRQNDRSNYSIKRLQKDMNSRSMASLVKSKQTKERFYQMETKHRNNLNSSIKESKKLDLGHYISKIQHFSKNRQ